MKKLLLLLLLFSPQSFAGWCQYVNISASYPVPPNGGQVPLSWTWPYTGSSWSFNTTVPQDTYVRITDIIFVSKNVRWPLQTSGSGSYSSSWRSSYLVLDSLVTVAEHMGGQVHFISPLTAGPGYQFGGAFINQSPEEQNMIAIVTGYAWDSTTCRAKFEPVP